MAGDRNTILDRDGFGETREEIPQAGEEIASARGARIGRLTYVHFQRGGNPKPKSGQGTDADD